MSANIQTGPGPAAPDGDPQFGRSPSEADPSADGVVATGDRREEIHFERDENQLVVARHLSKPRGPLPPEGDAPTAVAATDVDAPPVEDVCVAAEGPSVWDARPAAGDGYQPSAAPAEVDPNR